MAKVILVLGAMYVWPYINNSLATCVRRSGKVLDKINRKKGEHTWCKYCLK